MVFVVKNYARLIRWDSSGALVTAKIPFNEKPYLLEIFIRYNITSRDARGHDDRTVGPLTQDEINRAKGIPELKEAKSLLAVEHCDNGPRPYTCVVG